VEDLVLDWGRLDGGRDVISVGVGLSGVLWTCGCIVYAGMKGRDLVIWVVCCSLLRAWIEVAVF
jgi:hypothetical protein